MTSTQSCATCGKTAEVPEFFSGESWRCPTCVDRTPIPEEREEILVAEVNGDERAVQEARLETTSSEDRRPCPVCGEMILALAAKCRYCKQLLDDKSMRARVEVNARFVEQFRRELHRVAGYWIF